MLFENQENLSESQLIDILIAATPVAYIVLDKEFRIHFINDYFLELRQLKKEDVLGDKCYNLSNRGKKCSVCAVGNTIRTGKKSKLARKDVLESGCIRYVDDYAIPLYNKDGTGFDYILEIMVNRDAEMMFRKQIDDDYNEIIHVLSALLEEKDPYTAVHSKHVCRFSVNIAKAMNLSDEDIFDIDIAASLHDIGKVLIPTSIINKPSKLSDEEFTIIKTHAQKSRDMIDSLSGFQNAKKIVQFHHERFDGRGYPTGIHGEDIPLGARIVAIADSFDAMTSTRSYRKAMSQEAAVDEIKRNSGTQFDPMVVDAFLSTINSDSLRNRNSFTSDKNQGKRYAREIRPLDISSKEEILSFEELHSLMTEEYFIQSILNNTPVSYVILDSDHNIYYASDYFYTIMGIEDKSFLNKKCTDFNPNHEKCRVCIVEKTLESNQIQSCNLTKSTMGGEKHFYVYGVPLTFHDKDYVIEIMIDRTNEQNLRIQHEKDLSSLIRVLSGLLRIQNNESSENPLCSIASLIAKGLRLSKQEISRIEIASNLCDIGLISMDQNQPRFINEQMYQLHPLKSIDILNELSGIEDIKNMILHHHENYDGSGFPNGLKGSKIPLGSRIIAFAHTLYENGIDLLGPLTERDYALLNARKGTILDPEIVEMITGKYSRAGGMREMYL